jgi:type I restriction enzyme S subunit
MRENMKPSGVNWIKDIPISWNTIKVKHLATDKNTLFLDGDWIESDVIEESGIRYLTTGNVGVGYYKEQGSGYISERTFKDLHCLKVLPNDLMVSRLNEPIGRACIVPDNECFYVVAVDNVIIRPNKNYNKKFLMYVMNTDGYAENGNIIARGATMSRVSRSQLGQFWIAYPELSEQTLIAEFLDRQCKKIDSIVTDLEKQIEILQKYKKSLISKTVTKGLDKSVPMKDSGIEWIGDIPEHYSLVPLKNLFWMYAGGDVDEYDFSDERTDKYKYAIYSNSLENNGLFGYMSKYKFKGNTITVTGRGDVGKALPRYDAYYPIVRLLVCVPQKKLSVAFFSYCINCADIFGDQTAMAQLTTQKLGVIKVPVPTYDEQTQIANYLDKQCTKIDSIVKSKKSN